MTSQRQNVDENCLHVCKNTTSTDKGAFLRFAIS